ncbi:MAG: radical SAM protein, partial [Candidatus Aminicenantales bacterium]
KKEKHIIPILESIAGRWPSIRFHTPNGLHVRSIDLKLARLLRRAGFSSLFLSQESFKKEWLDASGSKVSPGDLKRAIRHLKRAGFSGDEIFVYLMVGLPGQDFAEVKQDILRVWKLGVRPKLALFSPIPGTPQWEMMVADGIIPRDADPLLHNKALFSYRGGSLSPEDLEELKRLTLQPKNARTSL